MKQNFKNILLILAVLTALLVGSVCSVQAATIRQNEYYIFNGDTLYQWSLYDGDLSEGTLKPREVVDGCIYITWDSTVKVKKTSNKKSVMTIAVDSKKNGVNNDGSKWSSTTLKCKIKKPGTATYTLSVKNEYYKRTDLYITNVHVYEYTNPVASFKIGKKEYASKLNKEPGYVISKKLSGKLSVKANKGWTIKKIRLESPYILGIYTTVKFLKNNTNVTVAKDQAVEIVLYNKKADQYASVSVGGAAVYPLIFG